jgi:hypothetical protein
MGRIMGQKLLCVVPTLVKCTGIYLSAANSFLFFLAQFRHYLPVDYNILQLPAVNMFKARVFTFLIKPV